MTTKSPSRASTSRDVNQSDSESPTWRRPLFPGSLTDLHRFRKTVHGHDGSSRIVMVRKTDQRTFASMQNGQEPKLETITRETIETFRGQRTACKITTEKKGCELKVPAELIESLTDRSRKNTPVRTRNIKVRNPVMSFSSDCLKAHNEYRAKHGMEPLKLNKEMCKVSQDFADYLVKRSTLEHSNNNKYGENVYCLITNSNAEISAAEVVKHWYSEISKHNFQKEPVSLDSGHFTQIVWKASKELGVGVATHKGKTVVVANYYPPGNVIGQYLENIFPVTSGHNTKENKSVSSGSLTKKKTTTAAFKQACLEAHNKYRALHAVPKLTLDDNLCKFSEEWARICADKGTLEHRKNNQYGENIYCIHSTDPNLEIGGNVPVDSWYEEIAHHKFGKEPKSLKSGHFTQVIWKTSEKLGVGVAKKGGSIYVVCNYSPAGNFVGNFAKNVPPIGGAPESEESAQAAAITPEEFQLNGLKAHNEYRRKHGVPDLKLNKELSTLATDWAVQCTRNGMAHRPNNEYGENIYMAYSSDFSFMPSAKEAVTAWYDEIKMYSFGTDTINTKTLHFTQVVWKATTDVGIGFAKNDKGETYVVANYSPRGNYVGQFKENVLKPKV